jgi:hypothetical protein
MERLLLILTASNACSRVLVKGLGGALMRNSRFLDKARSSSCQARLGLSALACPLARHQETGADNGRMRAERDSY